MKQSIVLLGLGVLTALLTSCSPIQSTVTPRFVNYSEIPCTIDLVPDSQGKLAVIKWPVANIKAEVNNPHTINPIVQTSSQLGITVTSLKATFEYQNKALIAAPMPEYSADLSIHINPNETVGVPISFFDDAQRNIAEAAFSANDNAINFDVWFGTTVTVTFYGHDDAGNAFEIKTSFSALWGNWAT